MVLFVALESNCGMFSSGIGVFFMRTIAFTGRAGCLGFALALLLRAEWLLAQSQPGTLLWSYAANDNVTASPAIAPDGTIYLGTSGGLCAITNAGSNKWTFTSSGGVSGFPAIDASGTIYFGANDHALYAVNPDGSQKWSRPLQLKGSSPLIAARNTIVAAGYGYLYSLAFDGTTNWLSLLGDSGVSTPVMAQDGTIFVGGWDTYWLYAFNPDGSLKWRVTQGIAQGDTLAIGRDGILYFQASGSLLGISPAGAQVYQSQSYIAFGTAAPAIAINGTMYVASSDYGLEALSTSGELLWQISPGWRYGANAATPVIDASGTIYIVGSNSVSTVTPTGSIAQLYTIPYGPYPPPPSPAIGPDGTIYAAFGTKLFAIQSSGQPLAAAPWPMPRQNLRHTGKVEKPSLTPPTPRMDHNFDLQLFGEMGQPYTVQSTTNFLDWTFVTNVVATNLPMSVTDLTASNAPARFYRASTP